MVLVAFEYVEAEIRLMEGVRVPSPRITHRFGHMLYFVVFTHLLAPLKAMAKLMLTSQGDSIEALNNK